MRFQKRRVWPHPGKRLVWREQAQVVFTRDGVVAAFVSAGGRPVLLHVREQRPRAQGAAEPVFLYLLLTDEGKPVRSQLSMGQGSGGRWVCQYVFQPEVPIERLRWFAVASLDLEGKKERARAVLPEARRLGAEVLPLPIVGEPLAFELPTVGGGRFRSADYRGKVILIDCWATW